MTSALATARFRTISASLVCAIRRRPRARGSISFAQRITSTRSATNARALSPRASARRVRLALVTTAARSAPNTLTATMATRALLTCVMALKCVHFLFHDVSRVYICRALAFAPLCRGSVMMKTFVPLTAVLARPLVRAICFRLS